MEPNPNIWEVTLINRKISLGAALGLIVIAITVTIAVVLSSVNSSYNSILKDLPQKIERYSIIDEIDALVDANYYGAVDNEQLNAAIAGGYVDGLDKYSEYLTADEYEKYLAEAKGNMTGIGVEYSKNGDGYIKIDAVYPGSPAQTAGLAIGDVIVAFDGESITTENYDSMVEKLVGDKLTTVNLTYRRQSVESTISVIKGYEAKSVTSATYEKVGYIKISNFYSTTAKQVEDAVDKFTSAEVIGIVIDLRGNNSTNFNEALKALDVFIPLAEGTNGIAQLIDSDGNIVKTYTSTAGAVNTPIAVLVDKNTSASAEFIACELRDFGKAELVGEKTRGIGLVQDVFPLSDGSAVKLTVGELITYAGESFHTIGLEPDHEAANETTPESITQDAVYLSAAALFKEENTES